jgi:hypothetical protein
LNRYWQNTVHYQCIESGSNRETTQTAKSRSLGKIYPAARARGRGGEKKTRQKNANFYGIYVFSRFNRFGGLNPRQEIDMAQLSASVLQTEMASPSGLSRFEGPGIHQRGSHPRMALRTM